MTDEEFEFVLKAAEFSGLEIGDIHVKRIAVVDVTGMDTLQIYGKEDNSDRPMVSMKINNDSFVGLEYSHEYLVNVPRPIKGRGL